MGLFNNLKDFQEAKQAIKNGYYPYFIPLEGTDGTEVIYNNRTIIMAGSNNYLGLTNHPKVKEAAISAIKKFGTGCTGSRFLNGTLNLHEELEHKLARFLGKQSALCFSTGYQTNLGVIQSLVRKNDIVILDKEAHASLYDGVSQSLGKSLRFQHNNLLELREKLSSLPPEKGKLIAVDGVYSMEGDLAPLPEVVKIAEEFKAQLLVDDAHGIGVMGNGFGTVKHFDLTDKVDLIVGTMSKSLASLGGFVAGDEEVIHFIKHHSRSLIFSAAIPPANVATAIAALNIIKSEPERIASVHQKAKMMKKELSALGFTTGNSESPIIPIIIGDRMKTIAFSKALLDMGVFVYPIISPAVSAKRCMLRTCYMATHTDKQLEQILEAFKKAGHKFGLIS